MNREILTIEEIKLLVDTFYSKVRADDLLKDIFNDVIKDKWPEHLDKMYRFWQTVLLDEHTYFNSPFPPHARLPVEWKHFDRWLKLFCENIEAQFKGEKAQEAKWRAEKMAVMFNKKIEHHKNFGTQPLL